jgi:hypothetical protein
MDEQRDFFRIKNKGEIRAYFEDKEVHIIDLSAASAAIIPDEELPKTGMIELKINLFTISLNYDVLRKSDDTMVLIFNNEEQISALLPVLKNLRILNS